MKIKSLLLGYPRFAPQIPFAARLRACLTLALIFVAKKVSKGMLQGVDLAGGHYTLNSRWKHLESATLRWFRQ
jgi:hypothetical protein